MIPHLDEKLAAHAAMVAREMTRRARHGLFDGIEDRVAKKYVAHCTADDTVTRTRIIFTRDTGHHTSGWMKNPDYERCWHLSLSPMAHESQHRRTWYDPRSRTALVPGQLAEFDAKTKRFWVEAFFGIGGVRYVWCESPKTEQGKSLGVVHYRLFCDDRWEAIIPRGEVYSSELTELGWRSASQVLEEEGRAILSPLDPT